MGTACYSLLAAFPLEACRAQRHRSLHCAQVLTNEDAKAGWLAAHLPAFIDAGDVIVFASTKVKVDALVAQLQGMGVKAGGIHGDMDQVCLRRGPFPGVCPACLAAAACLRVQVQQCSNAGSSHWHPPLPPPTLHPHPGTRAPQHSRMGVLDRFKAGSLHVMVATDVAARGLDIKTIKTVRAPATLLLPPPHTHACTKRLALRTSTSLYAGGPGQQLRTAAAAFA
jgi:hypothetical protein